MHQIYSRKLIIQPVCCKMVGPYIVGLVLAVGFAQGDPVASVPTYIANIRNAPGQRIVGGWPAEDGQFPHTASIRNVGPTGGVGACTAAIITNQFLLTAAHCLARRVTHIIFLGQTNLTRPGFMLESSDRYIHENYDQTSTWVQTDDIGLLKLDRYVPYGAYIQPIRIQSSQRKDIEYGGVRLTISGYGRLDDWWAPDNAGILPENLHWVYQRGITEQECRRWYPNSNTIDRQTMCTQYYNETSQNPCTGDSGGALTMMDLDGKVTQVGIMSFGAARGCNTPNAQGYVRPEYYHDWIANIIGFSLDWDVEELETRQDNFVVDEQPTIVY